MKTIKILVLASLLSASCLTICSLIACNQTDNKKIIQSNSIDQVKTLNDTILKVFKTQEYDSNIILYSVSKHGVLIDAGGSLEEIIKFVKDNSIRIEYLILTHSHSDHIIIANKLKDKLGCKILLDSRDKVAFYSRFKFYPETLITSDTTINVGEVPFQIFRTPGHTTGGISIYFTNIVASGDALFKEGIGRTDFPGGNKVTLLNSIKSKLFTLPDNTIVIPGHGEFTTIGYEKENNPFFE